MKLIEYTIYTGIPYIRICEDSNGKYFTALAKTRKTCIYDEYDFASHGALARIIRELPEFLDGGYFVFTLPKNDLDVKFAAFKKTYVDAR